MVIYSKSMRLIPDSFDDMQSGGGEWKFQGLRLAREEDFIRGFGGAKTLSFGYGDYGDFEFVIF